MGYVEKMRLEYMREQMARTIWVDAYASWWEEQPAKKRAKLRMNIEAQPGGGKTFSAMLIAKLSSASSSA